MLNGLTERLSYRIEKKDLLKVPSQPAMQQVRLPQLCASEEQHELVGGQLGHGLELQEQLLQAEEVVPPTQSLPVPQVLLPTHPAKTVMF